MFNIQRLLNTSMGRQFISMLLGLGLAAMFRKSCTDKTCIAFKGPVISEVDGKTYQFGDSECSKFKLVPVQRDPSKKEIPLKSKPQLINGIPTDVDDEEDIALTSATHEGLTKGLNEGLNEGTNEGMQMGQKSQLTSYDIRRHVTLTSSPYLVQR